VIGKEQVPYKNKNYSGVDKNLEYARIHPARPVKPTPKSNLSPTSYENLKAFNET